MTCVRLEIVLVMRESLGQGGRYTQLRIVDLRRFNITVMISGALLVRWEGITEAGMVSLMAISTPPPREGLSLRYML